MTQESVADLDRSRVLLDDAEATIAVTRKLVDWRSAAAWAAFAGALALAVTLTERSPAFWAAAVLVVAGTVAYSCLRRRRLREYARLLLERAKADIARDTAVDNSSWDRSRIGEVPEHYLQPVDTTHPRQLEALMKVPPAVLKKQLSEVRSSFVAVVFFGVLAVAGVILALVVPMQWSTDAAESLLEYRFTGFPVYLLASIAAGVTLMFGYAESMFTVTVSRQLSALLVDAASAELPRLWRLDPTYSQGEVVRWTPTGYVLDPWRMSIPPQPNRVLFALKILLASLFGTIVLLLILAGTLGWAASYFL